MGAYQTTLSLKVLDVKVKDKDGKRLYYKLTCESLPPTIPRRVLESAAPSKKGEAADLSKACFVLKGVTRDSITVENGTFEAFQSKCSHKPFVFEVYNHRLLHKDELVGTVEIDYRKLLQSGENSAAKVWLSGGDQLEVLVEIYLDDKSLRASEVKTLETRFGESPEKIKELHTLFLNSENGGITTLEGLLAFLVRAGVMEAVMQRWVAEAGNEELQMDITKELFALFDTDGNGKLDFEEIIVNLSLLLNGADEEVKTRIFCKKIQTFFSKDLFQTLQDSGQKPKGPADDE
jgi:hypothetical protein